MSIKVPYISKIHRWKRDDITCPGPDNPGFTPGLYRELVLGVLARVKKDRQFIRETETGKYYKRRHGKQFIVTNSHRNEH